jgi:hypothetical protein
MTRDLTPPAGRPNTSRPYDVRADGAAGLYVEFYRAMMASRRDSPRPSTQRRSQSMIASAFDQTCVIPQCGHFTELPVSTDR